MSNVIQTVQLTENATYVIPTPPGRLSLKLQGTFGASTAVAVKASDYANGSHADVVIDDESEDDSALSFTAAGRRVLDGGPYIVLEVTDFSGSSELVAVISRLGQTGK
jgi:hypothetical protein